MQKIVHFPYSNFNHRSFSELLPYCSCFIAESISEDFRRRVFFTSPKMYYSRGGTFDRAVSCYVDAIGGLGISYSIPLFTFRKTTHALNGQCFIPLIKSAKCDNTSTIYRPSRNYNTKFISPQAGDYYFYLNNALSHHSRP